MFFIKHSLPSLIPRRAKIKEQNLCFRNETSSKMSTVKASVHVEEVTDSPKVV
ncbi:hypothetical protein KP509_36G022700 [Ceratopteris richardii]|uniref:Uncharacterized protein n=1 Tax=Ceratopteris richardii TaxID=49495 RepID=A0A8T2QBC3_CERRI|nr:hypothetical protein KP509_36G022700 [Ceratopteris richardii]